MLSRIYNLTYTFKALTTEMRLANRIRIFELRFKQLRAAYLHLYYGECSFERSLPITVLRKYEVI